MDSPPPPCKYVPANIVVRDSCNWSVKIGKRFRRIVYVKNIVRAGGLRRTSVGEWKKKWLNLIGTRRRTSSFNIEPWNDYCTHTRYEGIALSRTARRMSTTANGTMEMNTRRRFWWTTDMGEKLPDLSDFTILACAYTAPPSKMNAFTYSTDA